MKKSKAFVRTSDQKENLRNKMKGKKNNPNYHSYRQEPKKVRCVEIGAVFDSLYKAAKFFDINSSNITHVLKGRQNTAAGYHWEYA